MRGIRALLVACTIAAGVAVPLGLPAVALADSVGIGPMVTITGIVEDRPEDGVAGAWVVDGTEFQAVESTRLVEAAGPAEVGVQVAVLAWRTADGLQAVVIRVQSPAQTAWLHSLMARLRNALGLAARLRLRVHSQEPLQLQTQTRLRTQEQSQEQNQAQQHLQKQTQQQLQEQTQAQDRARQQTQTQTQTQSQGQTPTQAQDQAQTQQQTRSMLGR